MCCRCYIEYLKDEELRKLYDLIPDKENLKTEGELFPNDYIMAISLSKNKEIGIYKMKWGYSIGKTLIFNARKESLGIKNIFQDGIKNRRCVIPVSYYFEWQKDTKDKYSIKKKDGSVMYLAGIYRYENNSPVLTIITKDATDEMKYIHDRMPIILKKNNIRLWLNDNLQSMNILNDSISELNFFKTEIE